MKLKIVKVFLVLNFLLIFGVAGFGYVIFRDREVIKGSTLISMDAIQTTAKNLQWAGVVNWETDAERKSEEYAISLPETAEDLAAFESRLGELEEFAGFRLEQLAAEHADLLETQRILAETEETLSIRTQELADARIKADQLRDTLAQVQGRLSDSKRELAGLNREKSTLDRQVGDLELEIKGKMEQIAYLETQLALRQEEVERAKRLFDACVGRNKDVIGGGGKAGMPATVLAVDPKWSFVIINKGETDLLPMFAEAFVHRDNNFVGKIRVTQVERGVAIAEILTDTFTNGSQVEVGDTIFF